MDRIRQQYADARRDVQAKYKQQREGADRRSEIAVNEEAAGRIRRVASRS